MALASPVQLELHLDLAASAHAALMQQLLDQATAAVNSFCKRRFERQTYTEYLSGTGKPDLTLRNYPVVPTTLTVWEDSTGAFGKGPSAFTATPLTEGTQWALQLDGEDGTGEVGAAGILLRLGLGTVGELFYRRYTAAAGYMPSVWPVGQGNVKVGYDAGFSVDTVPADLQLAVLQLATAVYKTRKNAGLWGQSERLGEYSVSLATGLLNTMTTARELLIPYVRRGWPT